MLLTSSVLYLPDNGHEDTRQKAHMKLDIHDWSARNLFYVIERFVVTRFEKIQLALWVLMKCSDGTVWENAVDALSANELKVMRWV